MDTTAPAVPAEYQDLYDQIYADLASFQDYLDAFPTRQRDSATPVAFAANLFSGNYNLGPILIQPDHYKQTLMNVDGLKALGVKAINLDISFPFLYRDFYETEEEYRQYLDFYIHLVQDIRACGFKVVINCGAIFATGSAGNPAAQALYAKMTLEQYQQARMEMCCTMAQQLAPDYLSVITEPDTEAAQTGFAEVDTVRGSTDLVNVIVNEVRSAAPGVLLGAGVGTWANDCVAFVESYALTGIDFIDMHIYPVNRDYLPRAAQIADTAKSYGKSIGVTESWLEKMRDSELGTPAYDTMSARHAWSFWAPLDAMFLQELADLATLKGFDFFSAFWSEYFRAYIQYSSKNANLLLSDMLDLVGPVQSTAMMMGSYSSTGIAYLQKIAPPDIIAPTAPPNLVAQPTSASSVKLTWSPASDNIGPAGYRVSRDGTQLTQTASTYYSEAGLSSGCTYTYSVVAFDASGNVSPAATVGVTTPDNEAPSVPTNVAAVAALDGSQINIIVSWAAAADNVGVAKYRVYRGESPSSLSQIATATSTSYTLNNVPPERTYYFAVAAADARGNSSPLSKPAVVATPTVPDVTPPTVTVGYPKSGAVISRSTYLYAIVYDTKSSMYETPSGVVGVQFCVGDVNVGPEQTVPHSSTPEYSTYRLQFDTRSLPNGAHVVTAIGRDKAGNTASSPGVAITVNN